MALHRLERDLGDLLGRFPEEALGGGMKRSLVFLDLDLGDTVHQDGNALRRVDLGRRDVEGHHFEREAVPGMEQRNHHVRASGDELHPSAAGDHDDLVRSRLLEKGEVGEDVPHDRDGDDRESGQHEYVSENQLHCRRPSFFDCSLAISSTQREASSPPSSEPSLELPSGLRARELPGRERCTAVRRRVPRPPPFRPWESE